ncbi:unnamed protein product [Closterium sp. Naga37s-1]|nr:unnamed protein product [Closterium sp. Naga37s-1]
MGLVFAAAAQLQGAGSVGHAAGGDKSESDEIFQIHPDLHQLLQVGGSGHRSGCNHPHPHQRRLLALPKSKKF